MSSSAPISDDEPLFSIVETTDNNGNVIAIFKLNKEATQWLAECMRISENGKTRIEGFKNSQFNHFFYSRYIYPYLRVSSLYTLELVDANGHWFKLQGSIPSTVKIEVLTDKQGVSPPASPIYTASKKNGTVNIDMNIDENTPETRSRLKKLYDLDTYISSSHRLQKREVGSIKLNITGDAKVLRAAHHTVIPQIEQENKEEKRLLLKQSKLALGIGIGAVGVNVFVGIVFPPLLILTIPICLGLFVVAAKAYKQATAKWEDAASTYAKEHPESGIGSSEAPTPTNDPGPSVDPTTSLSTTPQHPPALSTFTPKADLAASRTEKIEQPEPITPSASKKSETNRL